MFKRIKRHGAAAAALFALAFGAGSARATLVTISFSGTVDAVDAGLGSTVQLNDVFSGSLTYDTSVAANNISSSASDYNAITNFQFSAGSYSGGYAASTSGDASIQMYNDGGPGTADHISFVPFAPPTVAPDLNGFPLEFFVIRFDDSTENLFSPPLDLPTALNFGDFDALAFYAFFAIPQSDASFSFSGTITALTSTNDITPPAVPEPATLSLLGLGIAGFGALRRRRS